ncbi:MAG: hypothetical protein ACR2QK_02510 [Acidimicrobiales bacterium]
MALAKRSRGGMSGWIAAALLMLAIYASFINDSDPDEAPSTTPVAAVEPAPEG